VLTQLLKNTEKNGQMPFPFSAGNYYCFADQNISMGSPLFHHLPPEWLPNVAFFAAEK